MTDLFDPRVREIYARLDDMTPLAPTFEALGDRRLADARPQRPVWRRPAVSVAAAALATCSLIGIVWVVRDRSGTSPGTPSSPSVPGMVTLPTPASSVPVSTTTAAPTTTKVAAPPPTDAPAPQPELFPVVAASPLWPGGNQASVSQISRVETATTSALVGRRVDDRLTDVVIITATAAPAILEVEQSSVVIDGRDLTVGVDALHGQLTTAVVADAVNISFTAVDPLPFLQAGGLRAVTAVLPDGLSQIVMKLEPLPAGYELIAEPLAQIVGMETATSHVMGGDTADGAGVSVSAASPLLGMVGTTDLVAVDIGGAPGWALDVPGAPIAWRVGEHTWAAVGGNAALATSLDLARSVEFVDEATWRAISASGTPSVPPPDAFEPAG